MAAQELQTGATMARLVINDGTSEHILELNDTIATFGRAPENKTVLQDRECSRRHFQIERLDVGYKLVDLESRNGTRVNDRFVNQHLLRPGDRIQIGKTTLTFQDPNWREPPPEVAAMFPSAPAPAPPVLAAPVEAPPPSPISSGAPAPAPAPAPPPFEPRSTEAKRRSGATTSIDKVAGIQRLRAHQEKAAEQRTIKAVAVAGGLFLALIVGLIVVGSMTHGSDPKPTRDADVQKPVQGPSTEEQRAFDDIKAMDNLHADRFDDIIKACDDFKTKFSASPQLKEVGEIRENAISRKKSSKKGALDSVRKRADSLRASQEYAKALLEVERVLTDYRNDPEIGPELAKIKDGLVKDGVAWFKTQDDDARAIRQTDKAKARQIYRELVDKLGGGKVSAFSVQVGVAQASLDSLGN